MEVGAAAKSLLPENPDIPRSLEATANESSDEQHAVRTHRTPAVAEAGGSSSGEKSDEEHQAFSTNRQQSSSKSPSPPCLSTPDLIQLFHSTTVVITPPSGVLVPAAAAAEKTTMQQQQQQQLSLSPSRSPGPVSAAPPQAKKTVMVEPTVASGEGVTREGVAASTPRRTACARAALMGVAWSYDMMCYLWSLVFRDDSSAFLMYDRSVHDGCLYDGIA